MMQLTSNHNVHPQDNNELTSPNLYPGAFTRRLDPTQAQSMAAWPTPSPSPLTAQHLPRIRISATSQETPLGSYMGWQPGPCVALPEPHWNPFANQPLVTDKGKPSKSTHSRPTVGSAINTNTSTVNIRTTLGIDQRMPILSPMMTRNVPMIDPRTPTGYARPRAAEKHRLQQQRARRRRLEQQKHQEEAQKLAAKAHRSEQKKAQALANAQAQKLQAQEQLALYNTYLEQERVLREQKLERERALIRKEQLRKDPSALYRHYDEYLESFPLARGERKSQYHNNLLANRRMPAERESDLGLAIQYAKDN
jgi:hypothetical protein